MGLQRSHGATRPKGLGGFTLIELMVVLALLALVTGLVSFSVRPSPQQELNREGERLALWLESIRHQSRGQGRWVQVRVDAAGAQIQTTTNGAGGVEHLDWLYADTTPIAPVTLTLGPEPMLPPQQLQLVSKVDGRVLIRVGTLGLGPWKVQ